MLEVYFFLDDSLTDRGLLSKIVKGGRRKLECSGNDQDCYRSTLDLKGLRSSHSGTWFFIRVSGKKWGKFATVRMTWQVQAVKVRAGGIKNVTHPDICHSNIDILVRRQQYFPWGIRLCRVENNLHLFIHSSPKTSPKVHSR